ncbi:MAG TPA: Flp pilus assembly protein CpaB [Acidimicrobiia bacterium]|nr:Flp pilus assembly protein CpaB [Acidimicrobiia bacterium]
MRNWRVLTAIAAVVLAAIAGVLVWQYVNDADDRAESDLDQIEVLVATKTIQRGTSGETAIDNGLIETQKRVEKDVPDNALRPDQEKDIKELFAAGTIAKGRELFVEDFIAGGQVQNTSLEIADGKQAISISLDDSHGVAGFVVPGDTINLIVTADIKNGADPKPEAQDITVKTTAFLLPGVKVLGVGSTTTFGQTSRKVDTNGDGVVDENDAEPETRQLQQGLWTLEVTPRQAEQIAHAQASSMPVYATLNPASFDLGKWVYPDEIVEVANFFDQPLPKVEEVLRALSAAKKSAG